MNPATLGPLLTRYRDVLAAYREPRLCSRGIPLTMSERAPSGSGAATRRRAIYRGFARQLPFLDGAPHRHLRGLMAPAFSGKAVEALAEQVRGTVLAQLPPPGTQRMDVCSQLAEVVPLRMMLGLLGLPETDVAALSRWSHAAAGALGVFGQDLSTGELEAILAGLDELGGFLRAVDLGPGLLRDLRAADVSEGTLQANAVFLLLAGHQSTAAAIGTGVLTLLTHERAREWRRRGPQDWEAAVEELLRWEPPIQFNARFATEGLTIGGYPVEAGQPVFLALAQANRDPDRFPDPEALILDRPDGRHLAFGAGPHFCLGAQLARLEIRVTLSTLFERLPSLALAPEGPIWRESRVLRGLEALPVTF
jgi:pimeloyl-[acyl-carrier protein] synthase